jgi:hypothetical protein
MDADGSTFDEAVKKFQAPPGGFTDQTNEQIVAGLALEGDQTKDLLQVLETSGLNVSDFASVDDFFTAVRAEGANGTLGTGGNNAENRVNKIIKLFTAGGINAPGGAGGVPIFSGITPPSGLLGTAGGSGGNTEEERIMNFMADQRRVQLPLAAGQQPLVTPFAGAFDTPMHLRATTENLLKSKGRDIHPVLQQQGLLG